MPIAVDYASTRGSIDAAAATVAEVISDLPQAAPLAFVGHSMGNIVTRRLIQRWVEADDPTLHRCRAMVMLGPPNQGAAIARRLDAIGRVGGFGFFENVHWPRSGAARHRLARTISNPRNTTVPIRNHRRKNAGGGFDPPVGRWSWRLGGFASRSGVARGGGLPRSCRPPQHADAQSIGRCDNTEHPRKTPKSDRNLISSYADLLVGIWNRARRPVMTCSSIVYIRPSS